MPFSHRGYRTFAARRSRRKEGAWNENGPPWSPHEQANAVATDVGPAPTAQGLRILSIVLVTVSVIIFAIWTWLAIVHVHDRYQIDATSGVHMAIALNANHGILYRPL